MFFIWPHLSGGSGFYEGHQCSWTLISANSMRVSNIFDILCGGHMLYLLPRYLYKPRYLCKPCYFWKSRYLYKPRYLCKPSMQRCYWPLFHSWCFRRRSKQLNLRSIFLHCISRVSEGTTTLDRTTWLRKRKNKQIPWLLLLYKIKMTNAFLGLIIYFYVFFVFCKLQTFALFNPSSVIASTNSSVA